MLDIEIIKWGCQFADGFEWDGSNAVISYSNGNHNKKVGIRSMNGFGSTVIYPLFLQRVIEGINDQFATMDNAYLYSIKQDYSDIEVYYDYELRTEFDIHNLGVDQAKEQAITYIHKEQTNAN